MSIHQRKSDHIRINLEEDVDFPNLTNGLEAFHLVHQALPEMNLDEVDIGLDLFGKRLRAPILVSSMTGGAVEAEHINRNLAVAAEACGLAMGVGSQRAGLEKGDLTDTFDVRSVAPNLLLFANLGAVQLNYGYTVQQCHQAVEMIEADALILHLNPLQEVLQPEGDFNWRGLVDKIGEVCTSIDVPVIVKEVGWGISARAARQLIKNGVAAIDVAGAGGTSWSQVEMYRAPTRRQRRLAAAFADWGIPTAESLREVIRVREELGRDDVHAFASGGIRTGQDIAKCLALGADLVGLAAPFLKRATESDEAVVDEMTLLIDELRIAMFCCGAENVASMRQSGVIIDVS